MISRKMESRGRCFAGQICLGIYLHLYVWSTTIEFKSADSNRGRLSGHRRESDNLAYLACHGVKPVGLEFASDANMSRPKPFTNNDVGAISHDFNSRVQNFDRA